jgi:error-prone DNA polymerase
MKFLPQYAELHCLSNFTFLRGASHAHELIERACELGYSALAITDECSMAGIVRAYEAVKRLPPASPLKLIIGTEITLEDGLELVLLATDRKSYGHLCALITRGRRQAEKGSYRLARDDFGDGLPGCLALWVPGAPPEPDQARFVAELFPHRAWIAAGLFNGANDHARLRTLHEVSQASGLPLVAAGDVHMHVRSRRALQDLLTAIRMNISVHQAGYALHPNAERHLRMRAQLARIYPAELLAETVRIAERCTFSPGELKYEYPDEIVPVEHTPATYLRHLTEKGLRWRFPHGVPGKVRAQIEKELNLIGELEYEPFFLTVYDIVRFAKSREILCQGRGSAANSAVCYALGITEVDPAHMDVLFERFISRERNEPPDIDVDFEHQRREDVIQYIYGKYGRERAALAATVITYRPRSALRDVGKALGLEPMQVDRLAKSLAWWDGGRVVPERLREAGVDTDSAVIQNLLALVNDLIGFPRHLSQHVGGFVISRGPLSHLVPLENAAMPERTVIQWDKDDLETLGLMKVDVLGLGILSAIRRSFELINRHRGSALVMKDISDRGDDPAVYEMIRKADTIGVFQIESRAQMSMLPRLGPKEFYDLVIEIAIVRPGPIQGNMVHPYLKRRSLQPEEIVYENEKIKAVLGRTLGVPIFQEQVMNLAMVAAGFNADQADALRRAMAAWRRKGKLEAFQTKLRLGMEKNGYTAEFTEKICRQIQGFGEYGFPESHAASFALLAYVSAWLKYYEPAAFLAGMLNSQPMGFYSPSSLLQDALRHGVEVRPVDVKSSEWECTLEPPSRTAGWGSPLSYHRPYLPIAAVRLGLLMVRGFSRAPAHRIVAARAQKAFSDVADLARRAGLNRKELNQLAAAGALAALSGHRHHACWMVAGLERQSRLLEEAPANESVPQLRPPPEGEDIVADYESTGLTLGRHPLALLRRRLQSMRLFTATELQALPNGKSARTAGIVTCRQRPGTAKGVVFVTLEDETGHTNVIVWNDLVERQRRELLGSRLLGVEGHIQREGAVLHLVARRLFDHSRLLGKLTTASRDFH